MPGTGSPWTRPAACDVEIELAHLQVAHFHNKINAIGQGPRALPSQADCNSLLSTA